MKSILFFLLCFSIPAFGEVRKEAKLNTPVEFWVNDGGTVKKAFEIKPSGIVEFFFGALGIVPPPVDATPSVSGTVNTTTQSFAGTKTLNSAPVLSSLSNGFVKTSSGSVISSSVIVNADVAAPPFSNISGTKVQIAGTGNAGVVSTLPQTFGGDKIFNGALQFGDSTTDTLSLNGRVGYGRFQPAAVNSTWFDYTTEFPSQTYYVYLVCLSIGAIERLHGAMIFGTGGATAASAADVGPILSESGNNVLATKFTSSTTYCTKVPVF